MAAQEPHAELGGLRSGLFVPTTWLSHELVTGLYCRRLHMRQGFSQQLSTYRHGGGIFQKFQFLNT